MASAATHPRTTPGANLCRNLVKIRIGQRCLCGFAARAAVRMAGRAKRARVEAEAEAGEGTMVDGSSPPGAEGGDRCVAAASPCTRFWVASTLKNVALMVLPFRVDRRSRVVFGGSFG